MQTVMDIQKAVKGLLGGIASPQEELPEHLETWEDHLAAYQQANEVSDAATWYKVDILYSLVEKFGRTSLAEFAKQVHERPTTFVSYMRAAKAFPKPTRVPELSFEAHLQASYADSYKDQKFLTDNRFQVLEQAASEGMSGQRVRNEITKQRAEAQKEELKATDPVKCKRCDSSEPEVYKFIFYSPEVKNAVEVWLHRDCFEEFINTIDKDHVSND